MPIEPQAVEITGTEQHAAWQRRVLPPVEKLRSDLWSIPVPIPNNPLRYVSVYVLAGENGLTLIDAGWESEQSWTALTDGLKHIGASITDVHGCLVTHQHFDHIGLAQRVREESGAWIAVHPADRDAIVDPQRRAPDKAAAADRRWMMRLGASEDEATRLSDHGQRDAWARIAVPDRLIEDGQRLVVPGWSLRAVHTPGHTPGHLCFVADDIGLLFAGDHVLPRISPNISADRDPEVDALADFLRSLEKIAGEEATEVLPAHEWRFAGLPQRVRQLLEHHEARLSELLHAVREHPGETPWQLAGRLTWSRPWDQYDGHLRYMAVSETAAHIVHLWRRGLVTASADPARRYTATDQAR